MNAFFPMLVMVLGMVNVPVMPEVLNAFSPILCSPSGNETDCRSEQPKNVPLPILCSPSGNETDCKLEQPVNAPSPIVFNNPLRNVTEVRPVHSLNASDPIFVTELGMVNSPVMPLLKNAFPPMLCSPSGNETDCRFGQIENASNPML